MGCLIHMWHRFCQTYTANMSQRTAQQVLHRLGYNGWVVWQTPAHPCRCTVQKALGPADVRQTTVLEDCCVLRWLTTSNNSQGVSQFGIMSPVSRLLISMTWHCIAYLFNYCLLCYWPPALSVIKAPRPSSPPIPSAENRTEINFTAFFGGVCLNNSEGGYL